MQKKNKCASYRFNCAGVYACIVFLCVGIVWGDTLDYQKLFVTIAEAAPARKIEHTTRAVQTIAAVPLIVSHRSLILAPRERTAIEIGYKNTGTTPLAQRSEDPITLRSAAARESFFYDRATWVSKTSLARVTTSMKPGALEYVRIVLEAPAIEGSYEERMALFVGDTPIAGSTVSLPIRVVNQGQHGGGTGTKSAPLAVSEKHVPRESPSSSPPLLIRSEPSVAVRAAKLIQSARDITMPAYSRQIFEVGYKNTGTHEWKSVGASRITIRSLVKRESFFYDPSWESGRIITPVQGGAPPGEIVYFRFVLFAPASSSSYTERMALFSGEQQIDGTQFALPIRVTKKVPATTLATYEGAPSSPSSSGVPSTALGTKAVLPSALFPTGVSAPAESTTSTDPVQIPFVPTGIVEDMRDVERSIRIGLFHTKNAVQLTAQKDYDVYDTNGVLLGSALSGQVTTVMHDAQTRAYTISTPTAVATSTAPVRFLASRTQLASAHTLRAAVESTSTITTSTPSQGALFTSTPQSTLPPSTSTSTPTQTEATPAPQPTFPDQDIVFEMSSYTNRPGWSSTINDNRFRGTIEIRYTPATDRLWVINELAIEQYLKGIAETSNNSPGEYQKALIIAARTYAIHHAKRNTKYASEHFTMKTTDADQVYRGYNAELRLANVSRAVADTRGVIIAYNGELAITPYYSQSDGRTRSWEEVWAGGPYPWLVSKPDPCCSGLPKLGHGVGMSARGALIMALEGKGFEQILKYYYTGVELRRVYQ